MSTHHIVSPILTVSGRDATGNWYFPDPVGAEEPGPRAGDPDLRLVPGHHKKVDGAWRIYETLTSYFIPQRNAPPT